MDFKKWTKDYGGKELAASVKEIAEKGGTGEFEEVPFGKYEVRLSKLELKSSKAGDPMLSVWMQVVEGSYKNSYIFMNQIVTRGFQIHIANEFMRSLEPKSEISFNGDYEDYSEIINDVFEECADSEFLLNYEQNERGYPKFTVEELY